MARTLVINDRSALRHNMLGMHLDYLNPDVYVREIMSMAERGQAGYCCVANVHMCVLAHDDGKFAAKINAAAFVVPDSTILQRARSFRFGVPLQKTLRGAEIMLELCENAAASGIKIALIGGKNRGVLATLEDRLRDRFPTIQIALSYSPPYSGTLVADEKLVSDIRLSQAKLIFVGLGCPKQENWMADHMGKFDATMIGVGAAFDFNAGVVEPSPAWVHRAGFEWLYRLVKEPNRLWRRYLGTSPRFVWLLLRDRLHAK